MMDFEREQSEFNMAVSYLNRLNALFYLCDEAAMELDVYKWFQSLVALFRELSTEMKDKEIETKNKEIELLFGDVNKYIAQTTNTGKGEVPPELYWKLHELELFLRKILRKAGLQLKVKEDAMDALR